jgi:hypothetical protein
MDQQEDSAAWKTPRESLFYGLSIPLIQEEIYEDPTGRYQLDHSR